MVPPYPSAGIQMKILTVSTLKGFLMSLSIFEWVVIGLYLSTTFPSLSIKWNLVKFHLIALFRNPFRWLLSHL